MKYKSRASPEQFATLLEFMESYGDITRPQQGPQGRIKADRLWQQLEELLNSIGGGVVKPRDKWKKAQPSLRNTQPSPTRDSNCTVCPPQISTTATDEIMLDFIPSCSIQATTSAFTATSSQQHPSPVLTPPPGTTSSPVPSATTPAASTSRGAPQRQRHQLHEDDSEEPCL
ncbi:uncharacterized protein LOC125067505 [Vanessa atalanta]|uniref:uncharacterized protein LOC125067505 n=1 Tax=Vanessa atalanta TaxID=42275 RepID=UPI001FCD7D56|nr:uncharacterized protein LOC125067505 [Vanessa atalanta]